MYSSHARELAALPGPRIFHRRDGAPARRVRLSAHTLGHPSDLGLASWSDLVRRSFRDRPSRLPWAAFVMAGAGAAAAGFVSSVGIVAGVATGLLAVLAWHQTRHSVRARRRFRRVLAQLDQGDALARHTVALETVLRLQPDRDDARLLLATAQLSNDDPVGALMQLAPLRDRHPAVGEIVLVAARAYAQLGLEQECLRMLDVLAVPAGHPAEAAVRRMQRRVATKLDEKTDPQGEARSRRSRVRPTGRRLR